MSLRALTKLYKNSKEINIDDDSKLVFISDVHKGDGTYYDDLLPNKNIYKTALKYYYTQGFTYVELGDGEELWKNKNCKYIGFNYEDIYKILLKFKKENRIHMIYGNHDIEKKNKNFYNKQLKVIRKNNIGQSQAFLEFIKDLEYYEGIKFNYKPLNETFLATHGNQADIINSDFWMISRFLVRYLWKFLFGVAGFREPTSPANSHSKRSRVDWEIQKWVLKEGAMVICGHTHNPRLPSEYEPPYLNDGACVMPFTMTAIELEKGSFTLVKWVIDSENNGILKVVRKKIGGPNTMKNYLIWARDRKIKLREEREGK